LSGLLVLVDGSSYLYRAFHALPDLRNPAGEPTGAIYGVLNMLRRLLADYKPEPGEQRYVACVFDAKGRTFRDDVYAEYKATRTAMPDDLSMQVEPLYESIKAMGWPLLCESGVEADDVIGTLARQGEERGLRSVISTGDKDLAQLVTERITLVNTMSNEKLDRDAVLKKFGVPPERIIDYLALVGDAIDNIPGVDKVGPKTACKLITQYGSLEGVIEHAAEVPGLVGENLRKVIDWLPKSKQLLTVKCDVPLKEKPEDLLLRPRNSEKLAELFDRFGFKTWLKEVQDGKSPGEPKAKGAARPQLSESSTLGNDLFGQRQPGAVERHYETITDEPALEHWRDRLLAADIAGFDAEATSADPMTARIVGLSFAVSPGHAAYLPLAHGYAGAPAQLPLQRALDILRPWLEGETARKVVQNAKFDQHVLANHGVRLGGVAHDTCLESYVIASHMRHDMESLSERCLGVRAVGVDQITGKGAQRIGFEQVELGRAAEYAAAEADITLQIHRAIHPTITADEKLARVYETIEMPVSHVLHRMERTGILVDAAKLDAQSRELGQKMMELEARAHREAGQPFNLNSPKQLCEIFFEQLKLPVLKKTATGSPSTDEEVLERLALDFPLPKTVLEYRALTKLKSTYTDKLPKMVNAQTGRVHTSYGQTTAVTGRLASTEPNLQNIPVRTAEGRRIREAFVAPAGSVIVSADYSQVELRIMAHLSGDESLIKAFDLEEDVHRVTAAEVFNRQLHEVSPEERRSAKAINFGLMYGMSAFGLAQNLGIDRATAQAYIGTYFARYPGVARFVESIRASARENGYVETVLGRRLFLPEIRSSNPARRAGAERAAINAPMQGTAADLIKLAMIAVDRWLHDDGLSSRLVLQVHDELVLEVPEAELDIIRERVPRLMTGVAQLRVPLVADLGFGPNWQQAH
jgi:DNA polymerase I